MWADVDTKSDFLNYSEVADLVVDVISDSSMRPVSVGVFGTWGTGKSTLLNLIENGLNSGEEEHRFVVVRFDAWLYQGFDDSRAALMEVIASTLIEASSKQAGPIDKAKKLWGRVNKMRALGLLVEGGALAMGVPTFGWASKGFDALGKIVSGEAAEEDIDVVKDAKEEGEGRFDGVIDNGNATTPPKEISAFRAEFADVLSELNKTLVVFVDNLDRCLPKQTIQTLEALRLFLFMGHTAFVIAADEDMVRHSVSEFFKNPGERHVTDYLDKLIQVPVHVPRLGVQEVRAYLFLLFATAEKRLTESQLENLRTGLEANLRAAWKDEPMTTESAVLLLGPHPSTEVVEGFAIADRIAPLLANSSLVQGNPRIVKRMLNVVRMRSKLARLRKMPVDQALISKVALFERCADTSAVSHLYSEINSAAVGKPELFIKLEKLLEDPERFKDACPEPWVGKAEFIREWLSLEPPLTNLDLRPLVYLSRETVPLRALKGGLSAHAAAALNALLKTNNTSSPTARAAISGIPAGEHSSVMAALIQALRPHADWTKRPNGFSGALLLAESNADCGNLLCNFIHTVTPGKLPPWISVIVKDAVWFKNKEKK